MTDILQQLSGQFASAGVPEQAAAVLGVLGVWLMIRESLWAFPVGLVQVLLAGWVFYSVGLFADMKLQAVFFVVLAYGWWHWQHPDDSRRGTLLVARLSPAGMLAAAGAALAMTAVWGWYLASFTSDRQPYADAFIASVSIVGQWLQARKKLENWHAWMIANAVAVPVYWRGGLYWFAVLYLLFLVMAVVGLFQWRASLRRGPGSPGARAGAAAP